MSKETFEILRFLSSAFVLIPLLLLLLRKGKLTSIQRKLVVLLIVVFINEVITSVLWYYQENNLPVYHFYTVIEFLLILNIYSSVLAKVITKRGVVVLGVGFTVFSIFNTLFIQNLFVFNSIPIVVLSVLVICITIVSFHSILKDQQYTPLNNNPLFWISAGLLIYFSSNLVLFYINNSLQLTRSESYSIWGLHAIVNILLISFYTFALWIQQEKE